MVIANLGHLSLMNNLQKLSSGHDNIQTQPQVHNPSSGGGLWMWNPSHHQHQEVITRPQPHQQQEGDQDDDSWEVRAFAEDTGSVMGTTWPPRSYTCTFCKREFRSAQALGGHMNVHRRDRARLHQGTASSSALIIPAQEFMAAAEASGRAGGLCLLYQLPPNHNGGMATNINACDINNLNINSSSSAGTAPLGFNHQHHRPTYNKSGQSHSSSIYYSNNRKGSSSSSSPADNLEELDLELRL